ncbi:MAG: Tol-Pal system beta propeller repeat protein TolB [Caulobacterales bacterium]|nr:Tol-Pal system beta propeller repeat protein TolB [Caulobacterales bacterium]
MSRLFAALLGLIAIAAAGFAPAAAQLRIDITAATQKPLPIAIPDFLGAGAQEERIGADLATVIANNLTRSGLFGPVDQSAFIERIQDIDVQPRFQDWRLVGADALLVGGVDIDDQGRLNVAFRLWDLTVQQQLVGLRIQTTPDNWRRVAHQVSDAIYERLTGETGYFDTRIVFIAESGPKTNRLKRLAIMDQDGANPSFLTDGPHLVLTPRFSPTNQQITFLSYGSGQPQVYLFNIETGRREVLGDFPGITFAPRFNPAGTGVIFTLEEDGNSDIWTMDLRTRQRQQLTRDPAIDTSPTYEPNGRRITFNSDRGGEPHIYVMNANGSNAQRISFGRGRYSTPVWSPRGDLIAFTKSIRQTFYIGVMRPDGTGERILTDGYFVEGPTWSPNGRVLMFTKETRGQQSRSEIISIDLTGFNERRVPTPGDGSDPAWSPLLD